MSDLGKKVSGSAVVNEDKLYSQFEDALKQNVSLRELKRGDIVEGVIVDIRPEAIIVDVGYKSEGIVAGKEIRSNVIDVNKLKGRRQYFSLCC